MYFMGMCEPIDSTTVRVSFCKQQTEELVRYVQE